MNSSVQTAPTYHVPVLLAESMEALAIRPNGLYVDATFGGGGHSRELLSRLQHGHLYSFDQDADAEANAMEDARFTFVRSNFRYLAQWMRYYDVDGLDGVLADLGVSSHHLDDEARGFSFRFASSPLDMRMNKRAQRTAADVLNTSTEEQLANVFYLYGELRQARRLAATVVRARQQCPFATTQQLVDVISPLLQRGKEKKDLARLFQALRIEVNEEMEALRVLLQSATSLLRPGGRLVVITYHSLEDRMVKNMMRAGNLEGKVQTDFYGQPLAPLQPLGKPITPSQQEVEQNPRSRSAKLRMAQKR